MSTENQIDGAMSIYQQAKELIEKYMEEYLTEGGQMAHFEKIIGDVAISYDQAKEFIVFMKKKSIRPSINLEADPNTGFFIHKHDQKDFNVEFFAKNSNGIVELINKTN